MSKQETEAQKMKEYLEHCKRKLDRCANEKPAVLTTIYKLSKVPVTAEALEATGILRTVAVLSNIQGEIGDKATSLLNKWKIILDTQKRSKDSSGNHVRKVINQKPNASYLSSKSFSNTSVIGNKGMTEVQKNVAGIHQKNFSSNSSVSKSQVFNDKFDVSRPCTSLTSSNSELSNSAHNSDLQHNYKSDFQSIDRSEDYISNPNLSISSENFDDSSDGPTKNKIYQPYTLELKEGMFRVVKLNPDDIPPYILRVRQLYDKALIIKSDKKEENDKDDFKNEMTDVSSSIKSEDSSGSSAKKSKKSSHACSTNVYEDDSPKVDLNFHSVQKSSSTEKPLKKKTSNSESYGMTGDERFLSAKKNLAFNKCKDEQAQVTEKKVKSKAPVLCKSVDKVKQHKSSLKERARDKSESPNLDGSSSLNAVESRFKSCDKTVSGKLALSEEEALRIATSKKDRTSVYSGKRKVQDVPTLRRCCIQVLKKNIDSIRLTKKVPYEVIKPVLQHCTPVQLRKVEECNNHLKKCTNELWKAHCQRDHRDKYPEKPESWKDMYWRIHEEKNRKLKNLAANIHASKSHSERQVKFTTINSTHHSSPKQAKPTENKGVIIIDSPVTLRPSPKQAKHSTTPESKISLKSSSSSLSSKKLTSTVTSKKPTKKESDAPLMSKVKKFMGLTSKYKK